MNRRGRKPVTRRRQPAKAGVLGFVLALVLLAGLGGGGWFLLQSNQSKQAATSGATPSLSISTKPKPEPTGYDGAAARATLAARRGGSAGGALAARSPVAQSTTVAVAPTTPDVTATPSVTPESQKTIVRQQLKLAWEGYKQGFIQSDGRVIDPQFDSISTSEGQSYGMLRAVWSDDRDTFERVYNWAKNNLQVRGGDKLFAYKWGKTDDGNWKVLDNAAATDAESDIALALMMAAQRWNKPEYEREALAVLTAVWDRTVVMVQGQPYLTAGDWAPAQARPTLNPSYLSPYAFRLFARLDPAHNWQGLISTSYQVIRACSELQVEGVTGLKLPANWCAIDKASGKFDVAADYPKLSNHYGYDAFRTMWRVALDYKWSGEAKALDYLNWSDTLRQKWQQEGKLIAEYDFVGKPVQNYEDLGVYAGNLANFLITDPAQAEAIVKSKLLPAFKQETQGDRRLAGWGDLTNYYSQNWVWFGLALYSDSLPNLATP